MDKTDVQGALVMLSRTNELIRDSICESENFVLLCEIQRDLTGFDSLVQDERKLIRQGCLLKHSRRGLQQRMFFLFTDVLIYASKPQFLQSFKVLGHVPVRSLLTENAEHNAFVIFGGGISITVSAGTTFEKNLWIEELQKASANLKYRAPQLQTAFSGMKCCSESRHFDACKTFVIDFIFILSIIWRRTWDVWPQRDVAEQRESANIKKQHSASCLLASWRDC